MCKEARSSVWMLLPQRGAQQQGAAVGARGRRRIQEKQEKGDGAETIEPGNEEEGSLLLTPRPDRRQHQRTMGIHNAGRQISDENEPSCLAVEQKLHCNEWEDSKAEETTSPQAHKPHRRMVSFDLTRREKEHMRSQEYYRQSEMETSDKQTPQHMKQVFTVHSPGRNIPQVENRNRIHNQMGYDTINQDQYSQKTSPNAHLNAEYAYRNQNVALLRNRSDTTQHQIHHPDAERFSKQSRNFRTYHQNRSFDDRYEGSHPLNKDEDTYILQRDNNTNMDEGIRSNTFQMDTNRRRQQFSNYRSFSESGVVEPYIDRRIVGNPPNESLYDSPRRRGIRRQPLSVEVPSENYPYTALSHNDRLNPYEYEMYYKPPQSNISSECRFDVPKGNHELSRSKHPDFENTSMYQYPKVDVSPEDILEKSQTVSQRSGNGIEKTLSIEMSSPTFGTDVPDTDILHRVPKAENSVRLKAVSISPNNTHPYAIMTDQVLPQEISSPSAFHAQSSRYLSQNNSKQYVEQTYHDMYDRNQSDLFAVDQVRVAYDPYADPKSRTPRAGYDSNEHWPNSGDDWNYGLQMSKTQDRNRSGLEGTHTFDVREKGYIGNKFNGRTNTEDHKQCLDEFQNIDAQRTTTSNIDLTTNISPNRESIKLKGILKSQNTSHVNKSQRRRSLSKQNLIKHHSLDVPRNSSDSNKNSNNAADKFCKDDLFTEQDRKSVTPQYSTESEDRKHVTPQYSTESERTPLLSKLGSQSSKHAFLPYSPVIEGCDAFKYDSGITTEARSSETNELCLPKADDLLASMSPSVSLTYGFSNHHQNDQDNRNSTGLHRDRINSGVKTRKHHVPAIVINDSVRLGRQENRISKCDDELFNDNSTTYKCIATNKTADKENYNKRKSRSVLDENVPLIDQLSNQDAIQKEFDPVQRLRTKVKSPTVQDSYDMDITNVKQTDVDVQNSNIEPYKDNTESDMIKPTENSESQTNEKPRKHSIVKMSTSTQTDDVSRLLKRQMNSDSKSTLSSMSRNKPTVLKHKVVFYQNRFIPIQSVPPMNLRESSVDKSSTKSATSIQTRSQEREHLIDKSAQENDCEEKKLKGNSQENKTSIVEKQNEEKATNSCDKSNKDSKEANEIQSEDTKHKHRKSKRRRHTHNRSVQTDVHIDINEPALPALDTCSEHDTNQAASPTPQVRVHSFKRSSSTAALERVDTVLHKIVDILQDDRGEPYKEVISPDSARQNRHSACVKMMQKTLNTAFIVIGFLLFTAVVCVIIFTAAKKWLFSLF